MYSDYYAATNRKIDVKTLSRGDIVTMENGEKRIVQGVCWKDYRFADDRAYPYTVHLSDDRGFCGCYNREGKNMWCEGKAYYAINIINATKGKPQWANYYR